ncbi:MAG: hypothetical protein M1820_002081 [Bogoriella megaspora]|nr:MAG: hypothetical protein M1820_002081 [Bogoriella megaspora]
MVYTGPSRGCKDCRKRRIKCDEKEPECTACVRARRKCPGYPDPFDVVHKKHTIFENREIGVSGTHDKKAPQIEARLVNLQAVSASQSSWLSAFQDPEADTLLPLNDQLPSEHQAVLHFLYTYIKARSEPSMSLDLMESIRTIYGNASTTSNVYHAISAISNVLFGFLKGKKEQLMVAQASSTEAMRLTREALKDPVESVSDQTFFAVLLLSMYEHLSAVTAQVQSLSVHYLGLAALVKYRETEGRPTAMSQYCLYQLHNRLTNAVLNSPYLVLKEISGIAQLPLPTSSNHAAGYMGSLSTRLIQLRLQTEQLRKSTHTDCDACLALLHVAKQIEGALSLWPSLIPISWRPATALFYLDGAVYAGDAQVYESLDVASMWNTYRCMRIMVSNSMVASCRESRDCSKSDDRQTVCQQMVDGICASVPFHIGEQESNQDHEKSETQPTNTRTPFSSEKTQLRRAIGAMMLYPRLQFVLAQELDLHPAQTSWIQLQVSKILGFFRTGDASSLH